MRVFDIQLSAVFIPTSYGTVESTSPEAAAAAAMTNSTVAYEAPEALPMTETDIEEERQASIVANQVRLERELAEMKIQIEAMQATLGDQEISVGSY